VDYDKLACEYQGKEYCSEQEGNIVSDTMRRNLPKTISVLIFRRNLLNFSLKHISQTVKNLNLVYFN
jgi:hypothetical protein